MPLLLQLPPTLAALVTVTAVGVAGLSWQRPLTAWLRALLALAVIGLVLSVSGFNFGRDTGCALLAAMLAIKPSETYSLRDARSLVGFALFAPFATFLLDQGPLSLGLGLVAAVLALVALQRFAEVESGDADSDAVAVAPPGPGRAAARHRTAVGAGGVLAVPALGCTAVGRTGARAGASGPVGPDDPGRMGST